MALAKRVGKPLMIHDRDAHADVLALLADQGAPETVIFHAFSGDAAMDIAVAGNSGDDEARGAAVQRALKTALGLIVAFMVVEVVIGIVAHSLALLSDAATLLPPDADATSPKDEAQRDEAVKGLEATGLDERAAAAAAARARAAAA